MLRLIIDTSLGYMGVGIAEESELLASTILLKPITVTALGIKTLDFLFGSIHRKIEELNEVVVSAGPGTFTSLRVGISLAKGICMALGIPLVPVSSLDAMALTLHTCDGIIVSVIDGKNNNLYLAEYLSSNSTIKSLTPAYVLKIDDTLKERQSIHFNVKKRYQVFIIGFDVERYKSVLDKLYRKVKGFESLNINSMLFSIHIIAYKRLFNVRPVSAVEYVPIYLREPDVKLKTPTKNFINP
ncbi:MAG: tRNA (adenosine(37)-N6)-threonylcarbamoyltransferase complex dimerization subunit type 1 TsaB [bacterium]